MKLGVKAAVVDGQLVPGDVTIEDGSIAAVGVAPAARTGLAAPGFIDLQINGYAGVDFTTAEREDYTHVATMLAATGVTAFQPTLISLPIESSLGALRSLDPSAIDHARILGMHLEGPFLSREQAGAHDPQNMIDPDEELIEHFLSAGPLTHMTLAPELPGALELIDTLVKAGVTVSLGHTNCDAKTATEAFDRGARSVTHIFSAQRPWHHRDPGVSGVALVRDDTFVTAIVDGVHMAPEAVRLAANASGERFVLITDATAAAGQPDGRYAIGDRTVILKNGECRLNDGTLAGSVLTMDVAVRNMISLGYDPLVAIGAATSAPASLVCRSDIGRLAPGNTADVCVLDDSFKVQRTIVSGTESFAA